MEEEKKDIKEIEKNDNKEAINKEKIEQVQETKGVETKKERKGFCITSMVLGIVALVLFCIWYLSIPCAILAIIFGILGIKSKAKGMAIAGLVTGSIGLVVSILIIVFLVMVGMAVGFSEVFDGDDYKTYRNYDWYDYD